MYSYKSTGVDIKRADEIIKNVSSNFKEDKFNNFENFAGIYKNNALFKGSAFVSCCDGIGSKIIPLIQKNDACTIANDLIAMNLNDLITLGAKPLFFLDYIAVNNLEGDIIQRTIENLKTILLKYNCMLLGGEISELRDLIKENCFDIAGFMVGCYKEKDFLNKNDVKKGDVIIGYPSEGIHANGFSLIRKLYEDKKIDDKIMNQTLKPTKIYMEIIEILNSKKLIKAASNITGGGIYSNLKRSIGKNLDLKLDFNSIKKQEIFEIIKKYIDIDECYRVFNMGTGFCVFADKNNIDTIFNQTKAHEPFILGEVI